MRPGETGLTGPNLLGAVGRAVASAPDLDCSDALEALPARGYDSWPRAAALDACLRSPEELVPGTMTFVGTSDPGERAELIAWRARTGGGSGEE